MATVQELLKDSLRKIGVIATGQTPTNDELQDALRDLNRMLEVWSTKQIQVFASAEDNFSLVAGTVSYTMGTAGTASSVRAKKILSGFTRDSDNYDQPVEIISEKQYNAIPDKTTQGRPYYLFYDPKYALGYIYLYPTPDSTETMYIESLKLLHTAFTALTTTVSLPGEYEEAIVFNLAVRMAPEYGLPVPIEVAAIAASSLADIIELNASNQVEKVGLDPGITGSGRRYNIETDC